MRRETRPFVVEVRRGPKKTPTPAAPAPLFDRSAEDDMMRRAEEALFGKPEPAMRAAEGRPGAPASADPQPSRRILEALSPDEEPEVETSGAAPEPARRGRKPGSKNRPRDEIDTSAAGKRRRGRPRKHFEGEVRSVEVTPELASAALEIMARATPAAPATPVPRALEPLEQPEPAPKRPRGRPRKQPMPLAVAPVEDVLLPTTLETMSASRILNRYGAGDGPDVRAGRRWTRRLRGYAHPDHMSRRLSRT